MLKGRVRGPYDQWPEKVMYHLRCDVCGDWSDTRFSSRLTSTQQREQAALEGWHHIDGQDHCPKHKEKK